ncbi:tRNA (adenosine(37)-N6)-dimethylallyltransferase MiaA [Prochlorococcus marinus XMU1411]|uniref:tRNA (adenosine(37)-N6)-dimethylallyltransferase MiaA n=1 Tax=Prochlorococcus marinus TaxID=1219 RepID=UPI001ADB0F1A|nr:tRNA (adenosine(37)-N6)-dimethylallyltransferase MiaA [Prochlorococcus marinus]MBO8244638.1 tRNA (adenosine(37)-N6)-dimethylallyltransferase MiaA [Prochlorococcus marinus XMU1411]MBW3055700.1 tRNA (adenosine(37)-N6)-dimethylallyltransferase MiaA [Prochlorococcus marinus str. MU1411]MCR8537468.1 tRNA (adenosine(37)-N6)-dimethylallyltransferase MiaA [Prochlorococcus marinus CUG1430]
MSSYQPHVIVLIGPTASGKTELAIQIAEYFKTRIHNIDSRQIYKSMDIGTAKPSENQQKKIKHYLIDIEEPINPINVKKFQEIAQKSINREIKQKNLPFLVGGSGLYMNSITKGFFVPNVPPQNHLRSQLEELGQKKCWEILKNCDPISTKKINFADHIRTIRALEVFYVTGKPLSKQKVQKPPNWKILELGLDRENLKERILERTKNMFSSGILEETKYLIDRYGADLSILETIGYREAKEVLNNRITINKAIELTTTKTIQFAKRQKTWFRNKNNPHWLNNKNLLKDAIIKIESFLG